MTRQEFIVVLLLLVGCAAHFQQESVESLGINTQESRLKRAAPLLPLTSCADCLRKIISLENSADDATGTVIVGMKLLCNVRSTEEFKDQCTDALTSTGTLIKEILPEFLPQVCLDARFICTVLLTACFDTLPSGALVPAGRRSCTYCKQMLKTTLNISERFIEFINDGASNLLCKNSIIAANQESCQNKVDGFAKDFMDGL